MDVVVRTPHGDADIDIVAAPSATTLADLLRAVTGQAAPATTRVDGRAVATTRLLSDLDLVIGSMIDARPETASSMDLGPDEEAVGLVQLTGRGAGSVSRLQRGRYRIGTARRLHTNELERAPVETPAFELEVGEHGARVAPGTDIGGALGVHTPTIGGALFDREAAWNNERLSVGGRMFDLDVPYRAPDRRRLPAPADDGSIPFQRPPGGTPPRRRVVTEAAHDALSAGGGLWGRRRTDAGAFDIAFGYHADGATVSSIDLQRHRGAALVGSDRFTSALARTLLVELTALHGPADLDLVIASTPDHIAQWNWAKWLPHVRQAGPTSTPELFDDPTDMAAWATALAAPPAPTTLAPPGVATAKPITVLVLDDITLWSQRDSPIRSLLISPPPELRIIALCVGLHEAPGMCTSLIEEVAPADRLAHLGSITTPVSGRPALFGSLATQHTRLADAPHVVSDIRPALTSMTLAAEVARSLAPLDDLDAGHLAVAPTRLSPPTLTELVTSVTPHHAQTGRSTLDVPIGVLLPVPGSVPGDRTPLTLDLNGPLSTIVIAAEPARHDQTVASILLSAASQRRPEELAILIIGRVRPAWHSELPHIAGWAGRDEADDAPRLIHRVAHVLAEQPDLHVLVVVEHAFDSDEPMPGDLVTGMTELAESLPNVHVVLTGDQLDAVPERQRARCGVLVSVAEGGVGRLWRDERQLAFEGIASESAAEDVASPTALDARELIIRPTTHRRAMTPLERRLTRSGLAVPSTDDELVAAAVARKVSTASNPPAEAPTGPSLLPPPLPVAIDFGILLDQHQGDGVPIGLVDRPERAENEAYWWQPGSGGSILAAGSPRSGMTSLLDLIVTGVAARISADDLHLYAIEALPQRRRAYEALPHAGSIVTPDEPASVRRLIDGLHRIHAERTETRAMTDRPDIVLLVGDVSRLVRSLPPGQVEETMQQVAELAASGPSIGINVIAIASRVDDLGPLARLTGDRLVGATSDPMDRTRLGAPALGPADRHAGRCWSTAADRRMQLATPPESVEAEIARLAPEPAQQRRPAPIAAGAGS
ncbi:MAG: hypothetical protein AB8G14_13030 [Ilumatobacter sp.]